MINDWQTIVAIAICALCAVFAVRYLVKSFSGSDDGHCGGDCACDAKDESRIKSR